MSAAVAQGCSVNNAFKESYVVFIGKHLCRRVFLIKLTVLTSPLGFRRYSFINSRLQLIFKVAVLKNLAKLIGKHLWWSSLSLKLETVTLQLKNSTREFFSKFWYNLIRFYQYSESNYSTFPITLWQLPCWSKNKFAY